VRARHDQQAQLIARLHHLAHGNHRSHRLVGRPGGTVVDDHHPAPSDHAGEGDPTRQRGPHPLTRSASQVDPPMPSAERGVGRIEPCDDLRSRIQGPHPSWMGSERRLREREGQHPQGEDMAAERHGPSLPSPPEQPQYRLVERWRSDRGGGAVEATWPIRREAVTWTTLEPAIHPD